MCIFCTSKDNQSLQRMEVGLHLSFQQGHKPFLIIVYEPSNLLEIPPQVQHFAVSGSTSKPITYESGWFFFLPGSCKNNVFQTQFNSVQKQIAFSSKRI